MRFFDKIFIVFLMSQSIIVADDCTSEQIIKLVNSGYEKNEIDTFCNRKSTVSAKEKLSSINKQRDIDSWFVKLGVGHVSISYPTELQTEINALDSLDYVDRTKLAIDMGVYWTVNSNYMAGFNINGHGDYFTDTSTNEEFNINAYNYALSNIYFIDKIKHGLFLRGDIGIVKILVQSNFSSSISSPAGFGVATGGGYSFSINDSTSIQAEILFTNYSVEGGSVKSFQFLVSLLF